MDAEASRQLGKEEGFRDLLNEESKQFIFFRMLNKFEKFLKVPIECFRSVKSKSSCL